MTFYGTTVFPSDDDIPFIWEGSINLKQTFSGSPYPGESVTQWSLKVRLKETLRIDVKDENKALIGQFVRLDDAGSSWSGNTSGTVTIPHTICSTCYGLGGYDTRVFSGGGSGSGNIITPGWGWIYYSMSDDDPLSAYLPNGFYSLSSSSGTTQQYNIITVRTDFCSNDIQTSTRPSLLGYKINGTYYIEPFGAPDGSAPESLTSSGVLSCVTGAVSGLIPKVWDKSPRILTDGMMTGSFSTTWQKLIVNQASWSIVKVLDIHPVIEKPDEKWRPMGDTEKNTIDITARIKDYPDLEGKWRFTLYDLSNEKGYCMNAGEGDDFDLEFKAGQSGFAEPEQTGDGFEIETDHIANSATVTVESLDYGAWGHIKAEVNVGGHWYEAEPEGGQKSVTIPVDADGNRIADCWEEDTGISGEVANADNDSEPELTGEQREPGDGFSNYEEYRGFIIGGEWEDTDPVYKDIFIYDEIGYGVGYFDETELDIHLINEDEYKKRVVNFNRGYGTITTQNGQKGLYLIEKILGADGNGATVSGMVEEVGTPNVVDWVSINSITIDKRETVYSEDAYRDWLESQGFENWLVEELMVEWNERYDYDSAQEGLITEGGPGLESLYCTIAHELGHGVNIPHHGTFEKALEEFFLEEERGNSVAVHGGIWSGDVSCVMRYVCAKEYLGLDGVFYEYPCNEVNEYAATTYCTEKKGTGINAGGQGTGDATEGECLKRLTLKGYFRDGN